MSKYYITGGSDDSWIKTNAKTLNGAKAIASKTYQQAVGGKIEVAELEDHGEDGVRYVRVAVKHGYDNWQQA